MKADGINNINRTKLKYSADFTTVQGIASDYNGFKLESLSSPRKQLERGQDQLLLLEGFLWRQSSLVLLPTASPMVAGAHENDFSNDLSN